MQKTTQILLIIMFLSFFACNGKSTKNSNQNIESQQNTTVPVFNQDSAYSFVKKQVDFGARVPNSAAHTACLEYLSGKLQKFGAEVIIQNGEGTLYNGKSIDIKNIIGIFNPTAQRRILLAAHWDSRPFADQDADISKHNTPILGANDGASGVGVLLEIARNLKTLPQNVGIDIIFFDVEDYGIPEFYKGKYDNDTWCIGSKYWANNPHKKDYKADYGILLDMVGAPAAKFYQEYYSLKYAQNIVDKVWKNANNSGFDGYFINQQGGAIMDDHLPINEIIKIPCIDIIQFDPNTKSGFNQYWHTTKDDMSNIDRNTLYAVGQTVLITIFK